MHDTIIQLLKASDTDEIKRLIPPESINQDIGEDGSTLAHYAASLGVNDVLLYCIESGADIEATTTFGTPLAYAVTAGSEECVKLLLDNGADVDSRGSNNFTPLMLASGGGFGDSTCSMATGAPYHYLSNRHDRCSQRMSEIKEDLGLFNIAPADPRYDSTIDSAQKVIDGEFLRTFNFECPDCYRHARIAELLISGGASLDPGFEKEAGMGRQSSPLNCALLGGHIEVAKALIKHGAPINYIRDGEDPPICCAVREKDISAVNILIDSGASVDCVDANDQTPLSLAIYRESQDIIEIIKKHSESDKDEGVSLIRAAQKGQTQQIKELIDAGVNIEYEDSAGNTALTWACANYHEGAVNALLEAGANPDHVSNNGLAPVFEAFDTNTISFGYIEDPHSNDSKVAMIVEMLCNAGADINFDSRWGTPLNRAIAKRNLPAIRAISRYHGTLGGHFSLSGNIPEHYYENTALWLLGERCDEAFCEILEFCSEGLDSLFGYWAGIDSCKGTNFLTCAAEIGSSKAIEYLVFEKSVPVDFPNEYGATPLMIALAGNHLDIADQLVSYGASINAVDSDGNTVSDYARYTGDFQTMSWCRNKGLM